MSHQFGRMFLDIFSPLNNGRNVIQTQHVKIILTIADEDDGLNDTKTNINL
jgi:hypothetical protein